MIHSLNLKPELGMAVKSTYSPFATSIVLDGEVVPPDDDRIVTLSFSDSTNFAVNVLLECIR